MSTGLVWALKRNELEESKAHRLGTRVQTSAQRLRVSIRLRAAGFDAGSTGPFDCRNEINLSQPSDERERESKEEPEE